MFTTEKELPQQGEEVCGQRPRNWDAESSCWCFLSFQINGFLAVVSFLFPAPHCPCPLSPSSWLKGDSLEFCYLPREQDRSSPPHPTPLHPIEGVRGKERGRAGPERGHWTPPCSCLFQVLLTSSGPLSRLQCGFGSVQGPWV